jgi:hypothetical protein
MFTPNLVVGLTVMAVGVVLLLDTLGIRDAASMMKFWPALIVLFGASIIAQAFKPADPAVVGRRGSGGVPCFFLFLMGVALFWSFGLQGRIQSREGGPRVNVAGIMSNTRYETNGSDFRSGRVAAVMGRASLDLRQVKLAPGEVVDVDVFVAMGNAVVRIPDDWIVDASALPVMGAVEQRRFAVIKPAVDEPVEAGGAAPAADAKGTAAPPIPGGTAPAKGSTPVPTTAPVTGPPPRLRLHGFVMMGKVEVTS